MSNPPRYVLCPVGSAGDVFPFLAVGRALARRGRDVLVLTIESFRAEAERAGLRVHAIGGEEVFERVKQRPELWHPRRGLSVVMELVAAGLEPAFEVLDELVDPARDVLVPHILALSARLHQELRGTRGSTLHLAPSAYRSDFAQPVMLPGRDFSGWPRPLKRGLWWLVDRFMIDRAIRPTLDPFRRRLGLAPVTRIFKDWIHAPEGTIALFPEVFGPPQPDWPRPLDFAGFPAFDGGAEIGSDLAGWLDEVGAPPIVVTPGSANLFGRDFARAAVRAAYELDRPVLVLAASAEDLEGAPEKRLRHERWAPLGRVLERAAALVHHGGIGTTGRGIQAGVPQVVAPLAFDQPDNAARLLRLGVGDWIRPRELVTGLAGRLSRLLSSEEVAQRTRELARTAGGDGAERAADLLLARHEGRQA